jgi:predicted N-formylglutamate amidohydrolase
MSECDYRLLGPHDPRPVEHLRLDAPSPFVLTCEHAGKVFPQRLDQLGLKTPDLERHITYDIGAEGVARGISERLDAPLILQRYSRLVVDCNRAPHAEDFITELSETTPIPGNLNIPEQEAAARREEIFEPYHATIRDLLDHRETTRIKTILVSVHTCTPVYHGVSRPWHIGVMYDKDDRFARIVLELLQEHGELTVGENEPYELTHERDYTVPVHGELRNLPHVEFEVRQDLVATWNGQIEWAERLGDVLREGLGRLQEFGHL